MSSRTADALEHFTICLDDTQNAPLSGDRLLAAALVDILDACSSITETGTYLGYTTKWFQFFNKPYTGIEIDEDKARSTSDKAVGAKIVVGDSAAWLKANVKSLGNKPFLFLDAHWFIPWPLELELEILKAVEDPIILIHDFDDKSGAGFDPGNDETGPVTGFIKSRPDLTAYTLSGVHKIGVVLITKTPVDSYYWKIFKQES